jgi:hypothetical protein
MFAGSDLIQLYFASRGITSPIMIGANGGACVEDSILGGLRRGLDVTAYTPGIVDFNPKSFIYPYSYTRGPTLIRLVTHLMSFVCPSVFARSPYKRWINECCDRSGAQFIEVRSLSDLFPEADHPATGLLEAGREAKNLVSAESGIQDASAFENAILEKLNDRLSLPDQRRAQFIAELKRMRGPVASRVLKTLLRYPDRQIRQLAAKALEKHRKVCREAL